MAANQSDPKKKKKGFFAGLLEKLDKKLEEKSRKTGCGCQPDTNKEGSCCG